MGYSNSNTDDLEKLRIAFTEITSKFGSVDALLEALGLSDMPPAQRYGILFGCLVFICTVSAVLALLILGGSFQRIKQQAETGETTVVAPHDARSQRPLLMETLLDARERMIQNCPPQNKTEGPTKIMDMLGNVAPSIRSVQLAKEQKHQSHNEIPPMYEENYKKAYRTCQDKPGGKYYRGSFWDKATGSRCCGET